MPEALIVPPQGPPLPSPALPRTGADGPGPAPWPPWTAPVALLAGLTAAVVVFGLVAGVVAGVAGTSLARPPLALTLIGTVFQDLALVGSALAFAYVSAAPVRPWQFGLRPVRVGRAIPWVAVALGVSFAFTAAWVTLLDVQQRENLHSELGLGSDLPGVLATALVVTTIAPIAEELFFRGYFYGALSRWRGPGLAAVLTGLVFGAVHGLGQTPVVFLVPLAFLGFVLCLLYRRLGSIYPGIAVHVINNALAFGIDEHWGWQIPVLMAGALTISALVLRAFGGRSRVPIGSVLALTGAIVAAGLAAMPATLASGDPPSGIHKIRHVVIIMQENRSFDSYFGTYPGADGIPTANGKVSVCVPNPRGGCVRLFHDHRLRSGEGPHNILASGKDVDGGKMDGFLRTATKQSDACARAHHDHRNLLCAGHGPGSPRSVLGYATDAEIPNYWAYAKNFVLQDHMFEPTESWSRPAHLYMVSGWSAHCRHRGRPRSCVNDNHVKLKKRHRIEDFAWTDLTYLLHKNHLPWAYYVSPGTVPDCFTGQAHCSAAKLRAGTPSIWNPLPAFDTVRHNHQVHDIKTLSHFYAAARRGTLPAVAWIVPNHAVSEHGPNSIGAGQAYVTKIVNAIMRSPDWSSTAIFISWDDWGGRYDHVRPPKVDRNGYGLRVPGLLISPYARRGLIDHQTLSFDAFNKFIEDDFLGGQRLDPKTDGRPDRRLDVRESQPILGDLSREFDFNQPPAPPLLLRAHPR